MTNKIQCKNMNKYDFESGFAGECLVEMNDGQLKKVYKIEKGDRVQTEFGMAKVLCVLKLYCKKGETDLINVRNISSILKISPYHPIKWEEKWQYPTTLFSNSSRSIAQCPALYNFLLDGDDHNMIISNTIVSTLAHGLIGDLHHWYYGTEEVTKFLMTCSGWKIGLVQTGCIQTDEFGLFKGLANCCF